MLKFLKEFFAELFDGLVWDYEHSDALDFFTDLVVFTLLGILLIAVAVGVFVLLGLAIMKEPIILLVFAVLLAIPTLIYIKVAKTSKERHK